MFYNYDVKLFNETIISMNNSA